MEELEDLVAAAEKEKAKYQTLAEKLQNNQHPERYAYMLFIYLYDFPRTLPLSLLILFFLFVIYF